MSASAQNLPSYPLFMRRISLTGLPLLPDLSAEWSLRTATREDIPALSVLLAQSFEEEWSEERTEEALFTDETVKAVYVVTCGSLLAATASARIMPVAYPGSGYLHWVAAAPAVQGRGLGFTISLAVLHDFQKRGCRDAVLETNSHRIPAIATYLKLGFRPEYREAIDQSVWHEITSGIISR